MTLVHEDWESGLKVRSLRCLVLTLTAAVRAGTNHSVWQGYWGANNTRGRNLSCFIFINSAIIYQKYKTEKYNCWEYSGDAEVGVGSQCILYCSLQLPCTTLFRPANLIRSTYFQKVKKSYFSLPRSPKPGKRADSHW